MVHNGAIMVTKADIEKVLDEHVRPGLAMDGGGVDVIDWIEATGTVKVRLTGACGGCPMSQLTLQMGVERTLKEYIPQVKKVEPV
jgi:Fe-S cluster biogenesis protein NfuA